MKEELPDWLLAGDLPAMRATLRSDTLELSQALGALVSYRPTIDQSLLQFWSGSYWANSMVDLYSDQTGFTHALAKGLWDHEKARWASLSPDAYGKLMAQRPGEIWDGLKQAGVSQPMTGNGTCKASMQWLQNWGAGMVACMTPIHPLASAAVAARVLAAGWGPIVAETMMPHVLNFPLRRSADLEAVTPAVTTGKILREAKTPAAWLTAQPQEWMDWTRACAGGWRTSLQSSIDVFEHWREKSGYLTNMLTDSGMQIGTAKHLSDCLYCLCSFKDRPFAIGEMSGGAMVHFKTATQAVDTWIGRGVLQSMTPEGQQRNRVFGPTPAWRSIFKDQAKAKRSVSTDMPPLFERSKMSKDVERTAATAARRRR